MCSLRITAQAFTLNRSIFCLISQAARLTAGSRLAWRAAQSSPSSRLAGLAPGKPRAPLLALPAAMHISRHTRSSGVPSPGMGWLSRWHRALPSQAVRAALRLREPLSTKPTVEGLVRVQEASTAFLCDGQAACSSQGEGLAPSPRWSPGC